MWQWRKACARAGRWLGAVGGRGEGMAQASDAGSSARSPARWWTGWAGAAMLGALLLSGCASTVTTDVTAFRQPGWQNDPPRTYAFEAEKGQGQPEQQAQLDRATYQNWIADALAGHGFTQVPRSQARYLVSFDFDADPRLVRVHETYYPDPWYPWGPYWGPYGYYRPWGPWGWGPGYWPPQTVIRDVPATLASLRVFIREAAGNKRVYQVTAQNLSEGSTMPGLMPYLVRSAFAEFPMESGRPRRVTLEVDKNRR